MTIITYAALVLALLGLFAAWRAYRKNSELRERIAQVNSRVYHLRRELIEAQEKKELEITKLKFDLLQLQGDLPVTGDMKIGELVALHPQAQHVLAGFHIGGCASCAVDDRQTLAEAAAGNGQPLEPILMALNTLVSTNETGNGQVAPEQLKQPNVQLQF
jgi:hypothetical protein